MNENNDLQVLSATIYGESRGEIEPGKKAVANVVMNRVSKHQTNKEFGDGTVRSACLYPWQFSCWNKTDPNYRRLYALDFINPNPVLQDCIEIAADAIAGNLPDITNGALFYKVSVLPWPVSWGPRLDPVAVIGHHSFYIL